MVRTVKSVLLFDFDSLYRNLNEQGAGTGEQLGAKPGAWLDALESGELLVPREDGVRRRFLVKRAYADPKILGKSRGWLSANGVQVVDVPVPAGHTRGAAEVHMVLDALDALETQPEEFILLSADVDLTPLLLRLRVHNPRVVIYATPTMGSSYRAFADGTVEAAALFRILARPAELPAPAQAPAKGAIPRPPKMAPIGAPNPPPASVQLAVVPSPALPPASPPPAAQPSAAATALAAPAKPAAAGARRQQRPAIDREALAMLVRRVHQATNVPLFSPKTFADLFRILVSEVAANGYKFQQTSDNIAAEMNRLGRNVTKRQVGFVIKGLALRGHVFTAEDDPDVLADAFYDQVLYLADSAALTLTDTEKDLVHAWVVGFRREEAAAATPSVVASAAAVSRKVAASPEVTGAKARAEAAAVRAAPVAAAAPARKVEAAREMEPAAAAPVRADVSGVRRPIPMPPPRSIMPPAAKEGPPTVKESAPAAKEAVPAQKEMTAKEPVAVKEAAVAAKEVAPTVKAKSVAASAPAPTPASAKEVPAAKEGPAVGKDTPVTRPGPTMKPVAAAVVAETAQKPARESAGATALRAAAAGKGQPVAEVKAPAPEAKAAADGKAPGAKPSAGAKSVAAEAKAPAVEVKPAAPVVDKKGPVAKPRAALTRELDLEESILAAIADAVDVLVEDRTGRRGDSSGSDASDTVAAGAPDEAAAGSDSYDAEAPSESEDDAPLGEDAELEGAAAEYEGSESEASADERLVETESESTLAADDVPATGADGSAKGGDDDIGDEIQRILASYSRNR